MTSWIIVIGILWLLFGPIRRTKTRKGTVKSKISNQDPFLEGLITMEAYNEISDGD